MLQVYSSRNIFCYFSFLASLSMFAHMQMPRDKNSQREFVDSVSGCQVSSLVQFRIVSSLHGIECRLLPPPNSDMNMKLYVNVGQMLPRNLTTRQRCKYTGNVAPSHQLGIPKHASSQFTTDCDCLNKLFRLSSMYILRAGQRCRAPPSTQPGNTYRCTVNIIRSPRSATLTRAISPNSVQWKHPFCFKLESISRLQTPQMCIFSCRASPQS